ncbi:peroxisomal acyl-coenzyme a oxidase 1 [Phtheirospermum japonicum]|uniref:acyl-CoA oxidase n=1 Tax=Phtheirospermum japonicum TaxID=374723 RepID=A0A830D5S6_9LAMI|nr:peroxisomal acyl-coenzyme a oxidase 1 [Phtheirospermum japonicum]
MLPRKEMFKNTLRKTAYAWRRIHELRLSEEEALNLRFYMDEASYIDLHWGMFIPTIKGQGSDEQRQKWLPLAYKMQIIGCYAQTELGHGSNVKGLETTSTFDPHTDEFVIHSPTLTSSKWWPGGLGKVSTHAIVYARLILDGKDHGVHGFIVQVRSLEDHRPLPGITVGDIGMKFGNGGFNTTDNGVLRFDRVRIPRNQMLMRFVGEWLEWLYNDVTKRLQANDFSTLPEAHACTAGLKSITTSVTADGIEECRKLCGGHGYLCSSGLPELFAVYVPSCTFEGDNIVLLLQARAMKTMARTGSFGPTRLVARFLIKIVSQLGTGKQPVGTIAYMGRIEHLMQCRCNAQRAEDWLKPSQVLEAFEARAARMSVSVAQNLRKFTNFEQGFAELSADLVESAVAHCQLIVVSKFIEKVQQADIDGEGVKQQLESLCGIYCLSLLHKHKGDFLATCYLTPNQAALANDQLRSLYTKVRPNAVALVDAFNYSDHYLSSILGRYDGNVYPKLYEAAWKDPLNESDVPDGYEEYVRPLLKQQLHMAKL